MIKYIFILYTFCFAQNISVPVDKTVSLGDDWYEVTTYVEIAINMTTEDARKKANNKALKKAIEHHSGSEISSMSSRLTVETDEGITQDWFGSLTTDLTRGIVLEWESISSDRKELSDNIWIYEVTVKAKVGQQKGERDPLFKIETALDRKVYNDGDEVNITVTPSMDCYLYVFNISSNDSVYVLLPNQYVENNFARSGTQFHIPDENARKKGIKYTVGLLPGKKKDTERVKILALKHSQGNYGMTLGNYKMALKKLQYFLVDLPRDEVVESNIIYSIVE